jgi:hypothetical protein
MKVEAILSSETLFTPDLHGVTSQKKAFFSISSRLYNETFPIMLLRQLRFDFQRLTQAQVKVHLVSASRLYQQYFAKFSIIYFGFFA